MREIGFYTLKIWELTYEVTTKATSSPSLRWEKLLSKIKNHRRGPVLLQKV